MSLIPFSFWSGVNEVTFSTGLKGARFVGYFADDVYWFNSATPHGDVQNNVTSINNFSSNADLYSWQWFGYFLAPTTGTYTFYTASDDASYLWIGNNALGNNYTVGNALVNNGGLHGTQEVSGTVTLQANTYYALRIQFGENGGGDIMTVSFQGPGISKTTNGSGYYFGGQESYGGAWIAGTVPRFDGTEESGGSGIVTDQLICHLDSRNTSSYPGGGTTWFDLTGNSNATLTAAFWTGPFESHAGYMDMNASTTAYADLTLVGVNSSTPTLTIEMWIRPISFSGGGMYFGFGTYDLYKTDLGVGFNTGNADIYGLATSQLDNETFFGRWHHLVCVVHQTTSYTNNKIYLNGTLLYNTSQLSSSESATNRNFNNGAMRINGWRNDTNYSSNQDLTVFRVYKKELSRSEILQNFNVDRSYAATGWNKPSNKLAVPDGCRVYFDFEGEFDWYSNSGSYVRDYSGFSVYGLLSGGVAWNSAGGGNMQLRSANSRRIDVNRNALSLGIYYGSFTFVMVSKFLSTLWTEFLFGSNNALVSQENVNLSLVGDRIRHSHNSGGAPDTFAGFGAMTSETWYHIASSYDFNTYVVKIYLNGVPIVTNGFQERVIANQSYFLNLVNSTYYNYDLGLFMAYNRVLSDSEITTVFNSQKTRFGL